MDFKEFREKTLKLYGKGVKKFKIKGSWGIYDAYKHIRRNKWYDIGRPLTEHEFYSIVRGVNNLVADGITLGQTVYFPSRMGKLELRKFEVAPRIKKNGKLYIPYSIDWQSTLELWFEDEEARNSKTLIRRADSIKYVLWYNKYDATYQNKWFYEFELNRFAKRRLHKNIVEGITDTIW